MKRFRVISCSVFRREMAEAARRSPCHIDLTFLPKGLHEIDCSLMRKRIQEEINDVDEADYDAILLGYGVCNNGSTGLTAGTIPLVISRAHDCITLLMGSKERYLDYFQENPGVYFKSSGWIEGSRNSDEINQLSISTRNGLNASYEEMVEKYGEENARYLQSTLTDQTRHYGQITFIEMGVEPDDRFEHQARKEAEQRGWRFEKMRGNLSLIQRLLNGDWNERDFLVVPPGRSTDASYGKDIITTKQS